MEGTERWVLIPCKELLYQCRHPSRGGTDGPAYRPPARVITVYLAFVRKVAAVPKIITTIPKDKSSLLLGLCSERLVCKRPEMSGFLWGLFQVPREGLACRPPHLAPWSAGTWESVSHSVAQLMHVACCPPVFLGSGGWV